MPKYRVHVEVIAKYRYTAEVEAKDTADAEDKAIRAAHTDENQPEDFQVAKGYCDYDAEFPEQLTAICPDCDTEHPVPTDFTRLCHCGAIGVDQSQPGLDAQGEPWTIPHLIVNGVCTRAPWWHEDQDYCAPCGAKLEAAEPRRAAAV